jgi:hypothetical protein
MMKKAFLSLSILFYLLPTFSQQPRWYAFDENDDTITGPNIFPILAIADDFGPRYESSENGNDFHGGIDYNCAQSADELQRWNLIVSPDAGLIQDYDMLAYDDYNYKYLLVDVLDAEGNGNYTWLFGHVFDNLNQYYDIFESSIVLKRCEGLNFDKWGMYFNFGGVEYCYGQVDQAVLKVNGNPKTTTNIVNTNSPLAPMGDSGDIDYAVHLHLNTLPYGTHDDGDNINGDPCQFLEYVAPQVPAQYNFSIWSWSSPLLIGQITVR